MNGSPEYSDLGEGLKKSFSYCIIISNRVTSVTCDIQFFIHQLYFQTHYEEIESCYPHFPEEELKYREMNMGV